VDGFLTKRQLHDLLRAGGHSFWIRDPDESPIDVSPPVEDYLTVALEPDGTLKPEYRDLYFACVTDDAGDPRIATDPAFGPPADTGDTSFARGPARWLARRLGRFPRVWLWPKGGFDRPAEPGPELRTFHTNHVSSPDAAAIGLDLTNPADAAVFWKAVSLVGSDTYDIYVTDEAGREVYLMHHHDKIVVSIPDPDAFEDLLTELDGLTDAFEDWSGYRCKGDEGQT
jgi:hypothetical protein